MPLSLPIIDQFVHPALGLLGRALVAGSPWPVGEHFSAAPPQGLGALTYGVVFDVISVGAGHGRTMNTLFERYTPPLALVSVQYQGTDALSIWTQWKSIDRQLEVYFWEEPLPVLLWVEQAPDVSLSLYWLQT